MKESANVKTGKNIVQYAEDREGIRMREKWTKL